MPLEEIPASGHLPAGSRMPLKRNLLFTGREADLMALVRSVKAGETATIGEATALTGMGGIGKTQLAAEFVHRYGRYFAGEVYWLSSGDAEGVPAEVAACGLAMDLGPYFAELKLEEQVARVRSIWEEETPRLLVFDNCEDEELLREWRPELGGTRLIVTSWRGSWGATLGVQSMALGVLDRDESFELLQKFRPDLKRETAGKIAGEVGDLPLALHLAGSFLKRYERYELGRPELYLAALQRPEGLDHASMIGHKVSDFAD